MMAELNCFKGCNGFRNESAPEGEEKNHLAEVVTLINHTDKVDGCVVNLQGTTFTFRAIRTKHNTSISARQVWITAGASIAYFIIGLVRGYSSSALPSIAETDDYLIPSKEAKSWIGAIPPSGAFIGSLLAGKLMHAFGRRRTLQIAAPMYAIAWTWIALSPSLVSLLISRWLSGFCVGIVLPTAQVYISECSAADVRGILSSIPALVMSLGILASYILGTWIAWRELAWFSVLASAILLCALFPLPESPVWLDEKGKVTQTRDALDWLRLPPNHENIGLKNKCGVTGRIGNNAPGSEKVDQPENEAEEKLFSRKVFFSRSVLKPLSIGMVLLFFQQVSGIDAVIFFTVEIFKTSGGTLNDHLATIIVGLVQLLANCVSTVLIDKAGRKPLLLISGLIMTIANASMGYAFYADLSQNAFLGYLPLVSLITFMIGFSLGFGGIPFVLLGELFPTKHRSALSAFAASLNLLTMFAVIKTYHVFQTYLTSAGTFWLYASFCAASVLFVILCVPETKGKTLQEIEKHFRSPSAAEKQERATDVARGETVFSPSSQDKS